MEVKQENDENKEVGKCAETPPIAACVTMRAAHYSSH